MAAGRFPALPPSLPRRGNAVTQALARALLAWAGWRIEGEIPDRAKLVAIVAPHTSNWDFVLGIAAVYALGLRVRFLGKHTLFRPPLGWLMRWLGGTPVVRETPQGAVTAAVDMMAREEKVVLGLAPAGTRTRGAAWRSGFYHIAVAAGAPVFPIGFDYGRRAIRLFPLLEPGGDYAADLAKLQSHYRDVRGLNA